MVRNTNEQQNCEILNIATVVLPLKHFKSIVKNNMIKNDEFKPFIMWYVH